MNNTPEWRPITGWPYEVSDTGLVRHQSGTLKAQVRAGRGYLCVDLWNAGTKKRALTHRLVLTAFTGPCPDGMQARHLDGNRDNNLTSNLAWGTAKENAADKERLGDTIRGEQHVFAKLSNENVLEIRRLGAEGVGARALGRQFGVDKTTVRAVLKGVTWKHLL